MALKSDRYELQTDISFFYNAAATTRGCLVAHGGTAGTGAAMDQGANLCVKSTSAAPLGVLLNDVVDKDLTRTHLNQYKDEVQKGGKVTILRKGYVVTDNVTGSPSAGDAAYQCETTAGNVATSGTNVVGAFLSAQDADGYAKVEINLP
jgi:antitoxin (DNA-binding transcriptional repressor) of toxin-antitoxin stability system